MRRPTYDVRDKVVLITGAGQGIGLALAKRLHAQGARVALVDVNEAALARASLGEDRVFIATADVTDRAAMADAVSRVIDHHGRLDVVVANAGVTPSPATIRTMDLADYDRVVAINQTGVLNTVRPALEAVIASGGHVVVVASCAAFSPGVGGVAYMSTKAAAEQIGRALKLELAPHGATAGVAYFGFVDTPLATATLDDDPIGRRLDELLGWPLNHRITADAAAASIAEGIADRAGTTIAPARWLPYSLFRGVINAAVDRVLAKDRRVHQLIRDLEARQKSAR
ncbi:NADP-dependent 3-hydroxy acid dehydrogenase YdfG [Actinokineospora alba]|uniref:NADP-dependent 3-hydroxy acid dehydrogenase YdfG n=1 Tax=Actinokineospora alba TaxID=504798 RepID=A0A1H0NGF7_9PSEU|nr:short-chain dehydrogenase/reductase [Actinokineospora alba]TDP68713.1 NADP-dependent 3-hydroxy acid dehydrogenase YdfG [Actinokineospora alba]SDH85051.1 NADP-dependent 3-hydroxy acid dehydrogenase YdfG [Actinokineospora alba]SDO91832.1 NADP-dependent 3-hydroxy acid dehydrogenase YdfG [Actinokineospora alba]